MFQPQFPVFHHYHHSPHVVFVCPKWALLRQKVQLLLALENMFSVAQWAAGSTVRLLFLGRLQN